MLFVATLFTVLSAVGPQNATLATADYRVGSQDVLSIVVFGESDLTKSVTVDGDGTFDFPLIGRVTAAGLTARGISEQLVQKLKTYFVNPQVSVEVAKFRSQNIFVFGQVHSPGQYSLTGNMSVLQALAAAGSPTNAAASYVIVSRPAGSEPSLPNKDPGGGSVLRITIKELQAGQTPAGFALRDGDTVTVPKAETVYVMGEVKIPGQYAIEGDLTVMQAIAIAGGATDKGAVNRVKVSRLFNGLLLEVRGVKLSDRVKPGDTIEVPKRYF
jgi:polysaccharide export outer membrane protein